LGADRVGCGSSTHSDEETNLHGDKQGAKEGTETSQKVGSVHFPNHVGSWDVDDGKDGGDDHCRYNANGSVMDQWSERNQRDCHKDGHYYIRHWGTTPVA